MTHRFFKLDHGEDGVGVLTVNRPDQENFLDAQVLREFAGILEGLHREPDGLRVLIVTGAGDAFIGGVDPAALSGADGATGQALSELGQEVCRWLERARFLTIAAVNGRAVGGGLEVCLACDLALGSEAASFCQIEPQVGLVPGFGGTLRLQRRVGAQRARSMTYTARFVDAATARDWGLILDVTPAAELLGQAHTLARATLPNSAAALAESKALITLGGEAPLAAHHAAEARAFAQLLGSDDTRARFTSLVAQRADTEERT